MSLAPKGRRQHGVSLIEALVALAVMAIGMLGLVGVQSVLRSTSDVAKQRSEAVRLAQVEIEEWRSFTTLTGYNSLALGTNTEVGIAGSNATFTRKRTVAALAAPNTGKSLAVEVSWQDRTGENQSVRLATLIAGIGPELAGTLTIPGEGDVVRQPQGRLRGIPLKAVPVGGGKSAIKPPGAPPDVAWRFDDITGLIDLCQTSAATTQDLTAANVTNCAGNAVALSGFVRYHLTGIAPNLANALAPASPPPAAPLTVSVNRTAPTAGTTACYTQDQNIAPFYTAYFCAIPVVIVTQGVIPGWSGRVEFGPDVRIATLVIPEDRNSARVRVCRYFETSTLPDPPSANNDGNYTAMIAPLSNQNYLVMNAGDGTLSFECPTDPYPRFPQDPTPPPVTKQHQP